MPLRLTAFWTSHRAGFLFGKVMQFVDLCNYKLVPQSIGIYRVFNVFNEMSYIGSTLNLRRRLRAHVTTLRRNKNDSLDLQKDYNEWGEEYFKFEVLEISSALRLLYKEGRWIQKFLTATGVYNKALCPLHSTQGCKLSEATRRRNSEAQFGKKLSDETKKKMSLYWTGRKKKPFTKEHRAKLAEAARKQAIRRRILTNGKLVLNVSV